LKTEADLENLGFHYTVDYSSICYFAWFHELKESSSFKSLSSIWYLEIYSEVILHRLPTPFAV